MPRRAFTLVELLVSLSVLLVVIIATARIFGTTSKVAALGEASADLQATATAVEKAIRGDIARMARDGVLAIQSVAVRNDVNRFQRVQNAPEATGTAINATAPLLNPTLASTDFVRCDQIVFFGRGHEASQVYLGGRGKEQQYSVQLYDGYLKIVSEMTSYEFMVRIGHALQFPTLLVNKDPTSPAYDYKLDPDTFGKGATLSPPVPWMWSASPVAASALTSTYFSLNNIATPPPLALAGQPEARQWDLSRQMVLLADDGYSNPPSGSTTEINHLTFFHTIVGQMSPNSASGIAQFGPSASAVTSGPAESTLSIGQDDLFPNRAITSSRVDIAATSIAEFRALVETGSTSANLSKDFNFNSASRLPWNEKEGTNVNNLGYIRNRIFNSLFGANISGRTNGMWGYPRAEKVAPSSARVDSMVSNPLLAGNCSSIQIDWTWSNGTGEFQTLDRTPMLAILPQSPARPAQVVDVPLAGLIMTNWPRQPFMSSNTGGFSIPTTVPARIPWFGLPDSLFPIEQRSGVTMLGGPLVTSRAVPLQLANLSATSPDPLAASYATPIQVIRPTIALDSKRGTALSPFTLADVDTVAIATPPIDCARIEGFNGIGNSMDVTVGTPVKYSIYTYQAIFGPNGDKPYREARNPGSVKRILRSDYTPWPTALRFTITLHDPKLVLGQGRVFQFVVDLPKADQ